MSKHRATTDAPRGRGRPLIGDERLSENLYIKITRSMDEALRARGDVPARLGGHAFSVRYHRRRDLVAALQPWFTLRARRGIGVLVPPSAAEPWISRHPRLLGALEWTDRVVSRRCAGLGDHVLYHFVRTDVAA